MNRTVNCSSVIILAFPRLMQKWNGLENIRSFNKTPLTITSCALLVTISLLPFAAFDGISGTRQKYNAEQKKNK